MARRISKAAFKRARKRISQRARPGQASCRGGFKIGDRVTIRGGFFSGKPWKRGTPGKITKWTSCGVAEVRANVPTYDRGSTFDIPLSFLARRR